jgi:hypothetical protein
METREKSEMQERLYVESPPLGTTTLRDWVRAHREKIGHQYASELQRRFDRVSAYPDYCQRYTISGP